MKSKKILLLFSVVFLMASILAVTACNPVEYKVTFMSLAEVEAEIEVQKVKENKKVTKPADPINKNKDYIFTKWYKDSELLTPFEFDKDVITEDTTLYAGWRVKDDGNGDVVVTYDFQGGEADETGIVLKQKENFELVVPTRDGYKFIGWYSFPDAKGQKFTSFDGKSLKALEVGSSEITVYAFWYIIGGEPYEYSLGKTKAVDFTVKTLDGETVKLSDFIGKKAVFLSIWRVG